MLITIQVIGSESGDKSNVTHNWGSQKGVREAADSQKRGLRGKKFGNLCFMAIEKSVLRKKALISSKKGFPKKVKKGIGCENCTFTAKTSFSN